MTADELRAALHAYIKREDPETVANEPVALELARQEIAKSFFPMESEKTADPPLAVSSGGLAALPADYGVAIAVGRDFTYISPRAWQRLIAEAPGNLGGCYSIFGGFIRVKGGMDSLALVYNVAPLPIAGGESNWLSQYYAAIWLHAARAEQYRFIEDVESQATAESLWRGIVDDLAAKDARIRQAGGSVRMRSR
jgi:hypothetical protein